MSRQVDRAWEALIEAAMELEKDERAGWIADMKHFVGNLDAWFADMDAENEADGHDGE